MIGKERKSPIMPHLSIPSADRRQERACEGNNVESLCKTILETPRLSLIPITKIVSITESLSDPLNDYVKSKGLNEWKKEFESLGYGLWCIHSEFDPISSGASSTGNNNRFSFHLADDLNFKLPPPSPISISTQVPLMPIGYIHLSKTSFIHLGIFERYTCQGFATEALKKLLSVIFTLDGIFKNEVVYIKVDHDAIGRVVEKLGFREKDENVFSITRSEYMELWYSEKDFE